MSVCQRVDRLPSAEGHVEILSRQVHLDGAIGKERDPTAVALVIARKSGPS